MKILAEQTREGIYNFPSVTKVLVSGREKYYILRGGFRWKDNQGGYDEYTFPVAKEMAETLISIIDGKVNPYKLPYPPEVAAEMYAEECAAAMIRTF